ncbi:hypothetical protein PPERSA_00644 [Pseudocohnilembus persalinus]|uniref:Phosphate transporter n=1 Tax=Pseudocohnilembus persalinus TaxID=266149 RepID=A0A0V0QSS0_PSEPJ|nr:hypothetical protein PPERSA_00644 [Pseudocohnilembus persalinus]|eukprot:KRX05343.1 hypothetical protein PPERSA_00644 [Pseudocohnilembus persalinus]
MQEKFEILDISLPELYCIYFKDQKQFGQQSQIELQSLKELKNEIINDIEISEEFIQSQLLLVEEEKFQSFEKQYILLKLLQQYSKEFMNEIKILLDEQQDKIKIQNERKQKQNLKKQSEKNSNSDLDEPLIQDENYVRVQIDQQNDDIFVEIKEKFQEYELISQQKISSCLEKIKEQKNEYNTNRDRYVKLIKDLEKDDEQKVFSKDVKRIKNKQNTGNIKQSVLSDLSTNSELEEEEGTDQVKKGCWDNTRIIFKKNKKIILLSIAIFVCLVAPVIFSPLVSLADQDQILDTMWYVSIPLAFILGIVNGGNNVCDSMGAPFGSGILSLRQALILGSICEFLGAVLLGGNVSKTISTKILNPNSFENPDMFALCMLVSLGAASICALAVTIYGVPLSLTQAVIFGMAAAGIVSVGTLGIQMKQLGDLVLALVSSPIVGGLIAFGLYVLLIHIIMKKQNPFQNARKILPIIGFVNSFAMIYLIMFKGVKSQFDDFPMWIGLIIAFVGGCIIGYLCYYFGTRKMQLNYNEDTIEVQQQKASQLFNPLLLFSACCVAFNHGANDVSHCIGPLAGVLSVYKTGNLQQIADKTLDIPFWTLVFGGLAFSLGIILIGKNTLKTMGHTLTSYNTIKGTTILLSTSLSILMASTISMPVSTTYIMVGCTIGTVMAEKLQKQVYKFNWKSVNKIFINWVITIPSVFLIATYFYYSMYGVIYF